ncbi:hypothetical protein JRO89_XS03G0018900 [Xanthoceras sorbifolium]|uniref:FAR1 domain-containing protein n=1 Tax=Xanthoceras sorbifolium TaxID=99658 RepID=A0ABQ8I8D0_9ROSI|nr:hypothetical protein JRO89_XS03G0018900 [Xanthoceras sorbifolium]
MENQSVLEFDSDESDLDLQDVTYEQHGKTENDFPKDLNFFMGEDNKMAEQSDEHLSINGEASEPYIGMEFNSKDEAREFYAAYGRRTGFTIRVHHNRRSRVNNQVIGQDFVCSKEGFRAKKYVSRKDRVLPQPPITREGCQAMIRLALRDGVKWVVTKFVEEHTHILMSPSKVPWRGSGKHLVSEPVPVVKLNLSVVVKLSSLSIRVQRVGLGACAAAEMGLDLYSKGKQSGYKPLEDEKDKRIRELSLELYNERQKSKRRCAAYEEQLNMILKELEKHTDHISKKVADVVQSIRDIEEEQSEDSHFGFNQSLLWIKSEVHEVDHDNVGRSIAGVR